MGDRTRAQALYLALESGGFAVDPDSDGSDYKAVPALAPFLKTPEAHVPPCVPSAFGYRPTTFPGPIG